eukprot:6821337-Pyramimonas_sp.AAC.2
MGYHPQLGGDPIVNLGAELLVVIVQNVFEQADGDASDSLAQRPTSDLGGDPDHAALRGQSCLVSGATDDRQEVPHTAAQGVRLHAGKQQPRCRTICRDAITNQQMHHPEFFVPKGLAPVGGDLP